MLLVTSCISRIGAIERIEKDLNFAEKKWFHFLTERSNIEEILQEHISSTNWYLVLSYNLKPADLKQWKIDSLVALSLN